jgi:hypothetical protein
MSYFVENDRGVGFCPSGKVLAFLGCVIFAVLSAGSGELAGQSGPDPNTSSGNRSGGRPDRGPLIGPGAGLGPAAPVDPTSLQQGPGGPQSPNPNPRPWEPRPIQRPGAVESKPAVPKFVAPDFPRNLATLFQEAWQAKKQDNYAKLGAMLHHRRGVIKKTKVGDSNVPQEWVDDEKYLTNCQILIRQGKYMEAVELIQPRWEQRRGDELLNGDLGMALVQASLSAVVIDDQPVLGREQMKQILDMVIDRDPMQIEADVVRAWMIDANQDEEFLRLESRPSIIERNRRLLPIQQSLDADLGREDQTAAAQPESVRPNFIPGMPPGMYPGMPPGMYPGVGRAATPAGWPQSKSGVPESISRFLFSVISYSLGISRDPVFDEVARCKEFFNSEYFLMTDRSGYTYAYIKGHLWQQMQASGRSQWRFLDKPNKQGPWQASSLYLFRWSGKEEEIEKYFVQEGGLAGAGGGSGFPRQYNSNSRQSSTGLGGQDDQQPASGLRNLYNLLRDRQPIANGDLGQIGEYTLTIYDSSPVFVEHLLTIPIHVSPVTTFKSAWRRQKTMALGANEEGKYLVFSYAQLSTLKSLQGPLTQQQSQSREYASKFDMVPLFCVLEKEKGSVEINFYRDDQGERYLISDKGQKIYFTDSDMLELRTPGFQPGKPYKGRLIRPMSFSRYDDDLDSAKRMLKWACDTQSAALSELIGDIEKNGRRGKTVDELLFDAVFLGKTAISTDRSQDQNWQQTLWDHKLHIENAKEFFVSTPYGFDPRGRLFIWQNLGGSSGNPWGAGGLPGMPSAMRNAMMPMGGPGMPAGRRGMPMGGPMSRSIIGGETGNEPSSLIFLDENGEIVSQFYDDSQLDSLKAGQQSDFLVPSDQTVPSPFIGISSQWQPETMRQKAQQADAKGNLHLAATLYREMPPLDFVFTSIPTGVPSSSEIKAMISEMESAIQNAVNKLQIKIEFAKVLEKMGRSDQANEMQWGVKASWKLAVKPLLEEFERFAVSYGYIVSDGFLQKQAVVTQLLANIPPTEDTAKEQSQSFMARLIKGIKTMEQPSQKSSDPVDTNIKFNLTDFEPVDGIDQIDKRLTQFYQGKPSITEYLKAKQWLREQHPTLLMRSPDNEFESMIFSWKPLEISAGEIGHLDSLAKPSEEFSQLWNEVLYKVETKQYGLARLSLFEAAYHQRNAAAQNKPESLDYLVRSANAIAMLWLATGSESFLYGPVRFGTDFVKITDNELKDFIQPRMAVKLSGEQVDYYLRPIRNITDTVTRLSESDEYLNRRFFWFEYVQLACDTGLDRSAATGYQQLGELPQSQKKDPAKTHERESVYQAKQMLQQAYVQKRLTPIGALRSCDTIMERWPESIEAQEAEEMIKSILRNRPDEKKERQKQGKYTGE